MSKIHWVKNNMIKSEDKNLPIMSEKNIKDARKFHKSFPQYKETPLAKLDKLSEYLGVKNIFVKDESYRFGLNAFKVLGGSYAMAKHISNKTGINIEDMTYDKLTSDEVKEKLGPVTFYTATDGNHGRGVAWAANVIGQNSVVHMPKGTTETRLNNILKLGSNATIEEVNYDECVRIAAREADENPNDVIIQDTAWEGYEEIPAYIMQGYGTMASEAHDQLIEAGCNRPTHIFIQAGVGSLAGAVIGYYSNVYKDNPPVMVVCEPDGAACIYKSAKAADGDPHNVTGDMQTIMAGLCCGEPNITSWDILRNHVDCFISCDDIIAARGMRTLGAPLKGDSQVVSGESGAVTAGVLSTIMQCPKLLDLRDFLKLDENSQVLLFSTEGDTDPIRYKDIVWDGDYAFDKNKCK